MHAPVCPAPPGGLPADATRRPSVAAANRESGFSCLGWKKIDMGRHDPHTGIDVLLRREVHMSAFKSEEERAAWALAESLSEQARTMMRQAEAALETWKLGKE